MRQSLRNFTSACPPSRPNANVPRYPTVMYPGSVVRQLGVPGVVDGLTLSPDAWTVRAGGGSLEPGAAPPDVGEGVRRRLDQSPESGTYFSIPGSLQRLVEYFGMPGSLQLTFGKVF